MKRHEDTDFGRLHTDSEYRAQWDAWREAETEALAKIEIGPGRCVKLKLVVINSVTYARLTDDHGRSVAIPVVKLWRYRHPWRLLTDEDREQIAGIIPIDQLENFRCAFADLEEDAAIEFGEIAAE